MKLMRVNKEGPLVTEILHNIYGSLGGWKSVERFSFVMEDFGEDDKYFYYGIEDKEVSRGRLTNVNSPKV